MCCKSDLISACHGKVWFVEMAWHGMKAWLSKSVPLFVYRSLNRAIENEFSLLSHEEGVVVLIEQPRLQVAART